MVGRTEREALDKLAQLQRFITPDNALMRLSERLSVDLAGHALDAPLNAVPRAENSHAFTRTLLNKARRENLTLRDVYNLLGAARGHWVLCGSAVQVADTLQHWFETGAADGFNVMPSHFPGGLDDFSELVVPILQERGVFRRAYTGTTLRDHLGLARPQSPYAGRHLNAAP
ncbi:hypothetical protein [Roseomonas nitratireducens]|uniref:hypothetical protein n=1 Tax=Roseomonas nitratireducens TaxID=2820810 RepID=UPI001FD7C92E|nr:hypothetical protein [Neoroseomonas nitratireducens]